MYMLTGYYIFHLIQYKHAVFDFIAFIKGISVRNIMCPDFSWCQISHIA